MGNTSEFPMLDRLERALTNEYLRMSNDEIKKLNEEIKVVTCGAACSERKKHIASDMSEQVAMYCKNHIDGARQMERYKKLGLKIAYYRKLNGLTQKQLADKLNISRTHLSNIEAPNKKTSISLDLLFKTADTLQVDVKELF